MKSPNKSKIAIALIALSIMIAVGVIVVANFADALSDYPRGEFTIVAKETKTIPWHPFFPWVTYEVYLFYYIDEPGHCVETEEADFYKYNVGDIYPNNYTIAR